MSKLSSCSPFGMMRPFSFLNVATMLIAAIVTTCTLPPPTATETKGQAAVRRYIATEKHWRGSEYTIAKGTATNGSICYSVTFLADKRVMIPGGGESFEAFYDPKTDKIVNVLYGE